MEEPTSYRLAPPGKPESPAGAKGQSGPGQLLGGRYRLVSRLGRGGMGTVWRAHDEVVDREVAVKEPLLPDGLSPGQQQTMYKRMRREARTAARVGHPSVVTIHDVVVEGERPWIVMEFVQGRSLADELAEGPMGRARAAFVALAVVGALNAAHEEGVLHRDVKPANILLGRHDRVVLTDFGIARMRGEEGLTEPGALVGSPEFMAPERLSGRSPGPGSDLWSLGVVLYLAMEGFSPFQRDHPAATLYSVLHEPPQPCARATGAMAALITRMLAHDPADRPSGAEVRAVLEETGQAPGRSAAGVLRLPWRHR